MKRVKLHDKTFEVSIPEEQILKAVKENTDLQENLSAAAHLIHGSTEGRFSVCYCPGHLSKEEIEAVNYHYGELDEMTARYDPRILKEG